MGRKRHNWKARVQTETEIDRSEEKKIKLDLPEANEEHYDDSNALVLPSRKRKTKQLQKCEPTVKPLTKKERKTLQKIVATKEKKAKRASLLQSLQSVQATEEELRLFTSISEVHSQRFKSKLLDVADPEDKGTNAIRGSKKKMAVSNEKIQEEVEEIDTSDMSTDDEEENEERKQASDEQEGQTLSKMDKQFSSDTCLSNPSGEKVFAQKTDHRETNVDKEETKKLIKTETEAKPAVHIPLSRLPEIEEARQKLPILGEEQAVMECINENPTVIICGETGSGKTTQVPQFLYEAGYAHGGGIIGVTEPRRVAAISMSQRVATEMNLSTREVSYQIRFEGNATPDTRIKFMTDGVLLKEVQQDFLLLKYSVIIVDEAHERSVYTDILIGLLSRIVPLRAKKGKPLKLIIMSATLRIEDFTENSHLFRVKPPVVKVDSRQFPVTVHFNRRTPFDNYLAEAYKKACKIHQQLPEGGILIFVTSQQEVQTLCSKLKKAFPYIKGQVEAKPEKTESRRERRKKEEEEKKIMPKIDLNKYSVQPTDDEAEMEMGDDSDLDFDHNDIETEEEDEKDMEESAENDIQKTVQPLWVLPLYSLLSSEKQARVFRPSPEGCRLCVVATNVAETSLTIPNVRYVIDTGKAKTKYYDKVTGVSTFKITWASKASANQRAGRAGRVGPGHCYRLYSSAMFNDSFPQFSPPEITRRPVDDLVLQMKDMNIDRVENFPFPTTPDSEQIKAAEKLLISLGALEEPKNQKTLDAKKRASAAKITPLGRAMASFPVSPRYARMLAMGHQQGLLPYVIAAVAALSVDQLFIDTRASSDAATEESSDVQKKIQTICNVKRLWAGSGNSLLLGDLMVLLKAVGACEYEGLSPQFCDRYGIRFKAIKEVRKLRTQLTNAINMALPEANLCVDPKLTPPTDLQAKLLRQIALSGLADHIARFNPQVPTASDADSQKKKYAYECCEFEEAVYIHPTSALYKKNKEFVVYQNIHETSRPYMKGVVAVEEEWLPIYAPSYCTFSNPLEDPPPSWNASLGQVMCYRTSTFGRCCWKLPAVCVPYPPGLDRFKWFARFLLEGQVHAALGKYTPDLLTTPATMIKPWAKLQPRTEVLLKTLVSRNVDSHSSLLAAWDKDPKYMLSAFLQWLPESMHFQVVENWPPTVKS
ncbi:probable ATP-dependent RNA helicase DHX37 isoform X1 [Pomacea canaliculata]|uniref:probable ATP-dependent RNA helicase DHX37 isoform X1 n=1 Tax=Pomacea canaliculata TaxID=400727 RepID=UPI000D72DE3F|nr:probable ATP-dependent RNA helicase DHX37 isoform X1 [Pomacea canaliculata]XP_025088959.1 probable ATP-dependent RNA helicase DHX37 isoform X1 [Pomacea canaliculata]